MLYEEIANKNLRQRYLFNRYKELLETFAKENDKLELLLPPRALTNGELAQWYSNAENKTKLHHQFESLKKIRLGLSQVWNEYLASLKGEQQ